MVISKNNITEAVGGALNRVTGARGDWDIRLEHPQDFSYGDYATNVAFLYAKELNAKPYDFAEKLVAEIRKKLPPEIKKVEVAGAGFINFYLSKGFFVESITGILRQAEDFGKNSLLAGRKVMVEYTDPNPFKEFHIGHLMSNAIGESISRLIEAEGAEVKRACYQGDVGLHVAKAIWSVVSLDKMVKGVYPDAQRENIAHIWELLVKGQAYARGNKAYDENEKAKREIDEINKKIYDKSDEYTDEYITSRYEEGRKRSIDYFEEIYRKLGTYHNKKENKAFDFYFFESEMAPRGVQIVRDGVSKRIFEESQGAIVFKGEKHGLHTRVFISSQGLPTYEAKELALAKTKYEAYPYDTSLVITGNEVNEYFRVLVKALELVFPDLAKKTVHRSHGMLRLPTGKMSSRSGEVIAAESLLMQVGQMVREKIAERQFSTAEKERIAEAVAVGAIKYSILRQSVGGDIIFDFEKSISFEGDSGPYLQYSYARAQSVLRKARADKVQPWDGEKNRPLHVGVLERLLYRFPEVVERAGKEYEPHFLTTYLIELAGAFNHWYARERIIDAGEEAPYRLALTRAFATVMKNGLRLLGIPVLEQM